MPTEHHTPVVWPLLRGASVPAQRTNDSPTIKCHRGSYTMLEPGILSTHRAHNLWAHLYTSAISLDSSHETERTRRRLRATDFPLRCGVSV